MRGHFLRGLAIGAIFLLGASFIRPSYIYAGRLKDDAESYRTKGYEAQEKGDIDSAIMWYTKAADLDPKYAVAHNDLGILYEAKGWLDRAESEYQKALAIDPNYAKAHTNMALLYERRGELEKAAFHWMKRYKLGRPDDRWTNEAKKRLTKLGLLEKAKEEKPAPTAERPASKAKEKIPAKKGADEWTRIGSMPGGKAKSRPAKRSSAKGMAAKGSKAGRNDELNKKIQESLRLAEQRLKQEKSYHKKPMSSSYGREETSKSGPRAYYLKARNYYKKGEYSRGLDTIRTAKREYPEDKSLLGLEDLIKNKMKEERIEDHYNEGILLYRQKDFSRARKEFEAILNILPE